MKKNIGWQLFVFMVLVLCGSNVHAQGGWRGKWIGSPDVTTDMPNVWLGFKKEFEMSHPVASALTKISVDSKYWLYINDKMVVFEGGLKRGPNKNDTYYDELDLAPYLQKGKNTIAVLVWYFGKQGFSHHSSGMPGLLFELDLKDASVVSDGTWSVKWLKEYQTAPDPLPNFRLPESNILYDARVADPFWFKSGQLASGFRKAREIGEPGRRPWNNLVKRPIPLWKDFGVKTFAAEDIVRKGDTLICQLPYNMQFTPVIELEAKAGRAITFATDNYYYYNGSAEILRGEYRTKDGYQMYESLGWQNGHALYVIVPPDVQVKSVGYRETGYNTGFTGLFSCSDPFFNTLWEKARRTLYITMRDTYMDCPDRERAQWTGDAVLEAEEAFYALDTESHALAKKWLYELVDWQKEDGSIYGPVPSGNWDKELPDQVLASIGYYGIWTYYMHTGDRQVLVDLYPKIQRYFALWEFDDHGLVKVRPGGWLWGDWGDNKDMLLLFNLWYYLGLKGNYLMAAELGHAADAEAIQQKMAQMKAAFNRLFWRDGQYRDPDYKGETDDRVHALALLADIAEPDKYADIERVFARQEHASPYMEKYVYEAMYKMRLPVQANSRHQKRFESMVNHPYFTTLFEGWEIGSDKYGGGTVNHAWSGGGLTILSAYLAGIRPLEAGYKTFLVDCQLGDIEYANVIVPSVKGDIQAHFRQDESQLSVKVTVPKGTQALVNLPPRKITSVTVNQDVLTEDRNRSAAEMYHLSDENLRLSEGEWDVLFQY